jgi:hypothetical protein
MNWRSSYVVKRQLKSASKDLGIVKVRTDKKRSSITASRVVKELGIVVRYHGFSRSLLRLP